MAKFNIERLEELLDKYWSCETTERQEVELRRMMLDEALPERYIQFRELFEYQEDERSIKLSEDFDSKILKTISGGRKIRLRRVWISSIAASLVLLFSVMIFRTTTLKQSEIFVEDTFEDPVEALTCFKTMMTYVEDKLKPGQEGLETGKEKIKIIRRSIEKLNNTLADVEKKGINSNN